jgi:hypothetical protein
MTRTFLPWLRAGLSAGLTTPDSDTAATSRAAVTVTLELDDTALTPPPAALLGPGDVRGFDQRQVLRVDPPDGTGAHEPTRYPLIEFAAPSLPWLVTPTAADGDNRLRPWLTLIVLDAADTEVSATAGGGGNPGTLHIAGPVAGRLPDPADLWAGAHAQIAGAVDSTSLAATLAATPERALSRLMWPYTLSAGTSYLAAVVPSFEAGRLAGLGQPASPADPLTPAWTAQSSDVTLPVYYSWTFQTGGGGDFATLAALLRAVPANPEITALSVDLTAAGLPGPALAATGPLTAGTRWDPLPDDVAAALAAALAPVVAPDGGTAELTQVAYGAQYAGRAAPHAGDRGWFAELNLDPRLRLAAGLGAALVRANQDSLVAAAWQQLGSARAVNGVLDRSRLARAAATALHTRHLETMPAGQRLQLAAPASTRVRVSDLTVAGAVDTSAVPAAMLSPALRRFTRPRGPVARSAAAAGRGIGTVGDAAAADSADVLGAQVLTALNPSTTVPARMLTRVQVPAARFADDDPLAGLLAAPAVPAPLYPMLADTAAQFILPGADRSPPNAIMALAAEPRFVAALLVGFNTELARALTWRGYPLDQQATLAAHFWDYRGQAPAAADIPPIAGWDPAAALADIVPSAAAMTVLAVRGDLLRRYPRTAVYAVRAADDHTLADESVAGNVCQPDFTGFFAPDLRFFGFAMSAATARDEDGAGWFFVLQEQVTESRFGSDAVTAQPLTGTAADVAVAAVQPPVRVALHARDILPDGTS